MTSRLDLSILRYLVNLDRLKKENPSTLTDITGGLWIPQRDICVEHMMFSCASFYFSKEYPKWCEIVQKIHDMWEEEE
tara:strand:+ start:7101 stop:7334 length:234 start_codon:yes stop_codon:yes gene_type:complete